MHDTASDQNVGSNNPRAIDEESAVSTSVDGDISAIHGLMASTIGQVSAVQWCGTIDNMVCQDRLQVSNGRIGESRANALESSVIWREDGNVLEAVDGVEKACSIQGSVQGGEVSSDQG